MYVCRCGAARRYPCAAQTVRIDTTVALNTIPPRDAVGAGINCIPVQAIDRDLTKQALVPVLQSGMAARDLSPEHGACGGGVALKPGGHLERQRGKAALSGPACRPASYVAPMDTDCRIAASREMTAREKPATRD
jgi:hypothetical protein